MPRSKAGAGAPQDAGSVQEQPALDDLEFWVYLQPVGLYNVLASRPPSFLRRTLQYAQRPEEVVIKSRQQLDINLELPEALPGVENKGRGLTVLLAICECLSSTLEFGPTVSHLVYLPPVSHGQGSEQTPSQVKRVSVPIPDVPMTNPHLLLLIWDLFPDLSKLVPKASGRQLSTDLRAGKMLGLVPSGELVWSAAIPLAEVMSHAKDGGSSIGALNQQRLVELSMALASVQLHTVLLEGVQRHLYTIHLQKGAPGMTSSASFPPGSRLQLKVGMDMNSKPTTCAVDGEGARNQNVTPSCDSNMTEACGSALAGDAEEQRKQGPGAMESEARHMEQNRIDAQAGAQLLSRKGGKDESSALGTSQASSSDVTFRYLYSMDQKYVEEVTTSFTCPLCSISCRDFNGLEVHMVACHEHFVYDMVAPGAKNGPMVLVRVKDSIFAKNGRLIASDSDRKVDVESVLTYLNIWFYCRKTNPSSIVNLNASPSDVLPEEAMKIGEMGNMLANTMRQQSCYPGIGNRGLGTGSRVPGTGNRGPGTGNRGRGLGMGRKRVGGGRNGGGQASSGSLTCGIQGMRLKDDRMYFHAKTSMRMTETEMMEGGDSDDDTGVEELQKKIKRDLYGNNNLSRPERRFMMMWNQLQHRGMVVFSDSVTPARCEQFVEMNLDAFRSDPELYQCLLMHLLMLWDFALVDGACMDRCLALVAGTAGGPQQPQQQQSAAALAPVAAARSGAPTGATSEVPG